MWNKMSQILTSRDLTQVTFQTASLKKYKLMNLETSLIYKHFSYLIIRIFLIQI